MLCFGFRQEPILITLFMSTKLTRGQSYECPSTGDHLVYAPRAEYGAFSHESTNNVRHNHSNTNPTKRHIPMGYMVHYFIPSARWIFYSHDKEWVVSCRRSSPEKDNGKKTIVVYGVQRPILLTLLDLISAWIRNHIQSNMCDEITYP